MLGSTLEKLRWSAVILGVWNLILVILGVVLILLVYSTCGQGDIFPFAVVLLISCVRIVTMIGTGIAQRATAMTIISSLAKSDVGESVFRRERRLRYQRWLWWSRFAILITVLQFLGATYLMLSVIIHISDQNSSNCILGLISNGNNWPRHIIIIFMIMVFNVALLQCFVGSDVLRWRSFYATKDNAWKAHYREVFDHGIREALCCLGRFKYSTVLEEDEVYSVAQLLGDLVAYRASGTGHLEILAGLTLLQTHSQSPKSYEGFMEAPAERIREAAALHPFAEAAYTGLLLDFGRNPVLFPCLWLYRQGILTPWTRNRWPVLDGDNWWRGHAAAFLKYVNLSSEVLRRGRVNQAKCEAAYFIVVLHNLKSIVISVRGTETPEDIITDGLCRECILTAEDLDGLINGDRIDPEARQRVVSSLPHYGHSGIVEAARDLFIQIEGNPTHEGNVDSPSESDGFLSSLLGDGCECDGYSIRIVGHSLGGAIAALLGIRLHRQYPNLHVYTYGPLPCVDSVVADACSEFVTSIVYDDEFSARLSVASILRLRAAAIVALSRDAPTDSPIAFRLARRFLCANSNEEQLPASDMGSRAIKTENTNHYRNGNQPWNESREQDQVLSLWQHVDLEASSNEESDHCDSPNDITNPFYNSCSVNSSEDPIAQFMQAVPSSENGLSGTNITEMFLPGLIIHIVSQKQSFHMPFWERWRTQQKGCSYKAYIEKREAFKDIIVSSSMFLDHLPWRCHYAMKRVLEMQTPQVLLDKSQMV